MKQLERKHLKAIRWFHWINFPILFAMIYTGLMIYWAYTPYRVGFGRFTLFHFFPNWFYNLLGLPHRLSEGMAWHFLLMWIFAGNGVLYVLYTVVSGEWRYLVPERNSFRDALQVTLYDFGLSKVCPPAVKYNGAQRIAYTGIILMGFGSLLTGLAIYKPVQFGWLAKLLGGYQTARFEHFLLTLGYVGFFLVHVAQVLRAGWNNLRSMITGYDIKTREAAPDGRAEA